MIYVQVPFLGRPVCISRRTIIARFWKTVRLISPGAYPKNQTPGTAHWLFEKENTYGGIQKGVRTRVASSIDHHTFEKNRGGDRMNPRYHAYAPFYERHLQRFVSMEVVLAEVGILRGNGLAIWSDLFPNGRILGFDIDTSHAQDNEPFLKSVGAFSNDNVELHTFDQLSSDAEYLEPVLQNTKINILIDDGLHSPESIIRTFHAFKPYLADDFVYIIEDNPNALTCLGKDIDGYASERVDEISAVFPPEQEGLFS